MNPVPLPASQQQRIYERLRNLISPGRRGGPANAAIGLGDESEYLPRRNRLHSYAEPLVLLTFSASFAEQVWASTCDGAMRMGSTPSHAAAMAGMGHVPADSQHDPAPPSPECPLAAALAANGGCIFTYHPTPGLLVTATQPLGRSALAGISADTPGLIFASPQFRPPKS